MLRSKRSKTAECSPDSLSIGVYVVLDMLRFIAALTLIAPFAAMPSVEAKEVRVYSGRHTTLIVLPTNISVKKLGSK